MKDLYLIYWWCPEPFERESRFYAADQGINKETKTKNKRGKNAVV